MAQLRSVTCHMGSHSVTCYSTQVNTPRLNPSHAGRYSIYLPQRDGRLRWPSWLDSTPAGSWTWDLSITSPTPNQCNHQDNQWQIWRWLPRNALYELHGVPEKTELLWRTAASVIVTRMIGNYCWRTYAKINFVIKCRYHNQARQYYTLS